MWRVCCLLRFVFFFFVSPVFLCSSFRSRHQWLCIALFGNKNKQDENPPFSFNTHACNAGGRHSCSKFIHFMRAMLITHIRDVIFGSGFIFNGKKKFFHHHRLPAGTQRFLKQTEQIRWFFCPHFTPQKTVFLVQNSLDWIYMYFETLSGTTATASLNGIVVNNCFCAFNDSSVNISRII